MTTIETLEAVRRSLAPITRRPLNLGAAILPHVFELTWERHCDGAWGTGRVEAEHHGTHWTVLVFWSNPVNRRSRQSQADHENPAIAFANATDDLGLPDSFLAALRRPV